MHGHVFEAFHGFTPVAIKVRVFSFSGNGVIEGIFYQLVIDYNFVNDIFFFQCFKRPVESGAIVISRQPFPDLVFREGLIRRHNNFNNPFAATRSFYFVLVQYFNSRHKCKNDSNETLLQM